MTSNFEFLRRYWPALASIGEIAESYTYSDPNACLYKLGMFGERLVQEIFIFEHISEPQIDNTHANRIKLLKREGLLPSNIDDILYALRKTRNDAVHNGLDSVNEAKTLLNMTYTLSCWFMEVYGDWGYIPNDFVMPVESDNKLDYEAMAKDIEAKESIIKSLNEKLDEVTTNVSGKSKSERYNRANSTSTKIKMSEAETRYLIDEQLRKAGWEADTPVLRYSRGTRPEKGRNIAIAEWPTEDICGRKGAADYMLFVGLKMVAVIEAKAYHKDIPSVIDFQCKEYAGAIKKEDEIYLYGTFGNYKVPFVFATNGKPYLKQLESKSGIWFLDLRRADNVAKALHGWFSPDGIMDMLSKDIAEANEKLENEKTDILRDKNGLALRNYQINAIEATEKAIINGQSNVLLSMATGTGKTRTVLGMIYRFLVTNRFRRILFLVDRTTLGEQAQDVFKEVKLKDLMTLDEIYTITSLDDNKFEKETRIQIATVQSMVSRIINDDSSEVTVSDYDLIIVDEAHRGYTLDKEMSGTELLYRDQQDYMSKYRKVIEFFDAVKIALTATPALHTTEIFGKPVFTYSYREAVIEGYLVDHDAPHNIKTKLNTEGINYSKGETVAIFDPVTGEITNSDELEDELHFDVDAFNKKVITKSFNETVLNEISRDIDPESDGKTLIFAVNDAHADLIVEILKDTYCTGKGVDNTAIKKITGSIGDKKTVLQAVKEFKNERYPNIVVTVDLLTTGVDVPEITTLVFMRRIKSRILFEQMLGRATRLCPQIHKTHFEIYDPVGVYESLRDVNGMKPVTANPNTTFMNLIDSLKVVEDEEHLKYQIDMIKAKLQRKKRNISPTATEHFTDLSGKGSIDEYIASISKMPVSEQKEALIKGSRLFEILDKDYVYHGTPQVISEKQDKLVDHTRGYGSGQKPEDYIEAFAEFVELNKNVIAALNIVCTKPTELTRETLKSLRLELDRNGFSEQQLKSAIAKMTNEEITADIISIIRRYGVGSKLLSHEDRIHSAIVKLKKAHNFSKTEDNWINRIEKYLLNESVLNVDSFNEGSFQTDGGYNRFNKIFNNQLYNIVKELNEYLYDDGGTVA